MSFTYKCNIFCILLYTDSHKFKYLRNFCLYLSIEAWEFVSSNQRLYPKINICEIGRLIINEIIFWDTLKFNYNIMLHFIKLKSQRFSIPLVADICIIISMFIVWKGSLWPRAKF